MMKFQTVCMCVCACGFGNDTCMLADGLCTAVVSFLHTHIYIYILIFV